MSITEGNRLVIDSVVLWSVGESLESDIGNEFGGETSRDTLQEEVIELGKVGRIEVLVVVEVGSVASVISLPQIVELLSTKNLTHDDTIEEVDDGVRELLGCFGDSRSDSVMKNEGLKTITLAFLGR